MRQPLANSLSSAQTLIVRVVPLLLSIGNLGLHYPEYRQARTIRVIDFSHTLTIASGHVIHFLMYSHSSHTSAIAIGHAIFWWRVERFKVGEVLGRIIWL
jgi:hypothetical protein